MRVLAAHGSHGWQQVWTLPADPAEVPQTAAIPGAPANPAGAVGCKGPSTGWPEWAEHLSRHRAPYGGWLRAVTVPDGLDAHGALQHLRITAGLI